MDMWILTMPDTLAKHNDSPFSTLSQDFNVNAGSEITGVREGVALGGVGCDFRSRGCDFSQGC